MRCRAIPYVEQKKGQRMKTHALAIGVAAAAILAVGGCNNSNGGGNAQQSAQTPQAEKAAGNQTIASGIDKNSQFMATAKAAGLDQTLAGPGPYTVFVPDDAAFNGAPQGTFSTDPKNRAQLTAVLTNLILPGTVLVADIDKAIDTGKGKTQLATMGGSTLTATKEGGNTVLTDSSGHKATITQGDQKFTNGVVHHIDAMLMPSKPAADNAPAVGKKAG
jgi:uncharacterized surface protein with fasciclin (FAS1) repeats